MAASAKEAVALTALGYNTGHWKLPRLWKSRVQQKKGDVEDNFKKASLKHLSFCGDL